MNRTLSVTGILSCMLLSLFIIYGCGGGGGGGGAGINYTGVTSQALIDENNAYDIAVGTYEGGDRAYNFDNLFGVVQQNSKSINTGLVQEIYSFFSVVVAKVENSATFNVVSLGAVISENETIAGECGGNFSVDISGNDQTGNFSGSFRFNDFCEPEFTANGKMNVSGNFDPNTEEINNINMSFSNLSMAVEGESIGMNGSINLNLTSFPYRMTMSFVFEDNNMNKTYKFQNFVFDIYEGFDFVDIEASGRYYDHDYGYVEISTVERLRFYEYNLWPSSGIFVFTGDYGIEGGNTRARLYVIDSSSFLVDADTDGDGFFDDYNSGSIFWANAL